MIGIKDRINDAIILWENGRYEGAFLNVLIAIAATSRLRYPDHDKTSDREAFESFIRDHQIPIKNVEYRGECRPLESIFYKWLRCQLIHEASLPPDIKFMEDQEHGSMSIRAGGAPEYVLKLSHGWFNYFVSIVTDAPETQDIFKNI